VRRIDRYFGIASVNRERLHPVEGNGGKSREPRSVIARVSEEACFRLAATKRIERRDACVFAKKTQNPLPLSHTRLRLSVIQLRVSAGVSSERKSLFRATATAVSPEKARISLKEYCRRGVVAGVVRRYESNYHFPSRVRPAPDKKCAG